MRILLHIGQSKTGTSSLQSFLTRQRGELLKQGVVYPSPIVHGMDVDLGSHNTVADALTGKKRYPFFSDEEYFSQFFEQAARHGSHTMILSGEHFFGGEPRIWAAASQAEYELRYRQKLARLKQLLAGHEIEIIVFLRPQVDWLSSVIAQNITHGILAGRGSEVNDDRKQFEMASPLLNYGDRLRAWNEILVPSKFHVIPYVRSQLSEGNSISEFFLRVGLAVPARSDQTVVEANATLTREYIEVKRRLNMTPRSKAEERAIIYCLRTLSRSSKHSSTYRLPDDIADAVQDVVRLDNESVARDFMDGKPFPAAGSYFEKNLPALTEAEIDTAEKAFRAEFRKPRYRWQRIRYGFLTFARTRMKPLHALLHQTKRVRRWFAYR